MKALAEVIEYLKKFLADETADAWAVSYELPGFISDRYDDIKTHAPKAATLLNDDVIDWCAALDYEDSEDCISESTFRKNLQKALKQLQN